MEFTQTNPLAFFAEWMAEAEQKSAVAYPNAMQLATVSKEGQPSVRTVLLKGFSPEGFSFYTNYESRKGRELLGNPKAALCFFWDKLERQVRVEGVVSRLSRQESEAYFQSRPRLSQIGAYASRQSEEIPSRAHLEAAVQKMEQRFPGTDPIPLPDHWGGFLLVPSLIEFWQQGEFRLHDRQEYRRQNQGWVSRRLSP